MTPEQIRIVQTTWLQVLPVKAAAAELFYQRLFEINPSLRGLFHGDMRAQGEKLMQVIDAAVNGLSRFEQVKPMIEAMGRRHVAYGVQDHHYGAVGSALLWALEQGLGEAFTVEVRGAWSAAYGALATTMREAARGGAALPATATDTAPRLRGVYGGALNTWRKVVNKTAVAELERMRFVFAAGVLLLTTAIAWGVSLSAKSVPTVPPAERSVATVESPARFLLNALFSPALAPGELPLRWADPQRGLRCGPNTTVEVNGAALEPGALVPNLPFELRWHADKCQPFGARGPRFDGGVKFTIYREDWGFSASVETADLRVTNVHRQALLIESGSTYCHADPKSPYRCL